MNDVAAPLRPESAADASTTDSARTLTWPTVLLVAGLWGALAPFAGPILGVHHFDVLLSVRLVDHVVPGAICVVVAIASIVRRRSGGDDDVVGLALAMTVVLAGFFMAATHLSLVRNDLRTHTFPSRPMLLHTPPGVLLFVIGAWRAVNLLAGASADGEDSA